MTRRHDKPTLRLQPSEGRVLFFYIVVAVLCATGTKTNAEGAARRAGPSDRAVVSPRSSRQRLTRLV